MPRRLAFVLIALLSAPLLAAPGRAFAQASPVSEGPLGTPITPSTLGSWDFLPGISADEAARDAQEQGFTAVAGLREDNYGDWIGTCGRGQLIVFPDGRAYPL